MSKSQQLINNKSSIHQVKMILRKSSQIQKIKISVNFLFQTKIVLRKTSLNLIAQLLTNNNKLKQKFCKTMQINLIKGKVYFILFIQFINLMKQVLLNTKILEKQIKIMLSNIQNNMKVSNLQRNLGNNLQNTMGNALQNNMGSNIQNQNDINVQQNINNLLSLLKNQPINQEEFECFLWYIDLKIKPYQVKYIYKDYMKENKDTKQKDRIYYNKHKEKEKEKQFNIDIDPQQCLIGFCLSSNDILIVQNSTANLSTTVNSLQQLEKINQKQKQLRQKQKQKQKQKQQKQRKVQIKSLIQPNPKNLISYVGDKVHSAMSQMQPKYQRMHKSIQMETDRPKKITTNYQPIVRKNNYNNNISGSNINGFGNFNNNHLLNNLRGNETQRHSLSTSINFNSNFNSNLNTVNIMNNNSGVVSSHNNSINYTNLINPSGIKPRQSYEFQKSRPSMPVKLQVNNNNTYLSTSLNFENNGSINFINNNSNVSNHSNTHNNTNYNPPKTERQSESNVINRSKQFDFQKIKYQGIKLTSSTTANNQNSQNINSINKTIAHTVERNNNNNNNMNSNGSGIYSNSGRISQRKQQNNNNNFKYIKPLSTTHHQGIKYVSFFPKMNDEFGINIKQKQMKQRKTIDVFQYIKNR